MKESLARKCSYQEKIIDELFDSLSKSQPRNNIYFNSFFNKKIQELFEIEVNYLGLNYISPRHKKNDIELLFESKPNVSQSGGFKTNFKNRYAISMNTAHSCYKMLRSQNIETRLNGLRLVLKTLFHELRHLKQYMLIKANVSSKIVLRNAKEFMLASSKKEEYNKLYKENHDEFAIEADANYKGVIKRHDLNSTLSDELDLFESNIDKSNRDISKIVVNNIVHDRDTYINKMSDQYIKNKEQEDVFEEYPILLKEYNRDFTKKNIKDLIANLDKELNEALLIDDEEMQTFVFVETLELYYELIYRRLKTNDMFELYDAVNEYGKDEIESLCENIIEYFRQEKGRKISLLKEKYESVSKIYEDRAYKNDGMIEIKKDGITRMVNVDDYAKENIPNFNNTFINVFLHSKAFKNRIPNNGMFTLKDGSKMPLIDYLDVVFIPETKKTNSKLTIVKDYDELLSRTVKSYYEVDFIESSSRVNKDYQVKKNKLENILSYKMLDPNENILADIPHEVDNMRLVAKIDNEETKNILNCIMLCYMDHDGDDYFYVFTKEQIEYFLYLFEVAKSLDKNETFNPNGIKYFVKFRNNDAVKTIRKEIEKYYSLLNNSNKMVL